jgi:uncharacterized protein
MSSYRQLIAEYIGREAKPFDKFGHQPRLYALAVEVGAGQTYDDDVLYAAAWMHDLGVFIGHRPEDPEALAHWNNVAYALDRTPGVLRPMNFPEEKIPAVLEAIRTHQPQAEPVTAEAIMLRDADILEQLGAIGVLRAVCKIGRDTRFMSFTSTVETLRQALAKLPAQIRLDSTRALAAPKIRILRDFLEAVESEARGALY